MFFFYKFGFDLGDFSPSFNLVFYFNYCQFQSSQQNGDINLYGVKTLAKATAVADYGVNSMVAKATAVVETPSRSFYYRDPRLPEGWYVKVRLIILL